MDILRTKSGESGLGRRIVGGLAAASVAVTSAVVLTKLVNSQPTAEEATAAVCQVPQFAQLEACQSAPPTQVEQAQRQIIDATAGLIAYGMAQGVIGAIPGMPLPR